jgi:hypothetical protein
MRLSYILSLFFFASQLNTTNAQATWSNESDKSAHDNIKMLKEGALLVRLKTSENRIKALTRIGDVKGAQEEKAKQFKENKAIAFGFKEKLNFCKVYFFYSTYSDKISEGKLEGVLMNSELQPDSSYAGANYLVAEFGQSATSNATGLIILDKKFVQLTKPFPYLAKQDSFNASGETKSEVVDRMNKQLQGFWELNK